MAKFEPGKQIGAVRILLLEDDPFFAGLVRANLDQAEWADVSVEHAESLAGALAWLDRVDFDLIVTDLNLPDSAGLNTLDALVRATDRLVVVITGESDHLLRETAIAHGAYDLLRKTSLGPAELNRMFRLASMQANTFRSLTESEARFRSLTQLSADMFWEQDDQYRFTSFAGAHMTKLPEGRAASMLGKRRWDTDYFNMSAADWTAHKATLEARQPFRDLELGRLDGPAGKLWMSVSGEPVFDAAGAFRGYRGVGKNITERKLAEERQAVHLRYQQELARFGASALEGRDTAALIDDAVQGVFAALGVDAVAYVEHEAAELVVRSASGLGQRHTSATVSFAPRDAVARVLASGEPAVIDSGMPALPFDWAGPYVCTALVPVRGEGHVRGLLCALSRNAGALRAAESEFLATAVNVLSAALRRIDSESQLAFLAQFDALTGLPNRALLADRFSRMIAQARRHATMVGVLFIDLDGFKLVNDTLGHAGGDDLLKEVARRLQASVRAADTVARISGDEFAVILGDLPRPDDAALVAQKIIERLAAPAAVQRQEVLVTASVGIAVFPADGDDAEALLAAADAAMYRAKQSGRNGHQFFTADINQRTRARAQLGLELRRALERDEFALVYQPKFDLCTGRPCGAEALLRWRHPERGTVSPAEFIPALEETGLIVQVGEWVLDRACKDLKLWQAAGLPPMPVAVNLSARQFRQADLDTRILDLLRRSGVAPGLIGLEITESQVMQDPDHAKRVIQALSDGGVGVAIDDFGTGYSSLSYLTRFRVVALKVDRSFVADVLNDRAAAAIVGAIVDMAHRLSFIVIAEGVEEQAQARLLRDLGCEQAQGYYFAKPMPEADFRAWLSAVPAAAAQEAGPA
jgi:diguanylate cyclase (GGDEF)-like protein/PAS domain S-box-containing protein